MNRLIVTVWVCLWGSGPLACGDDNAQVGVVEPLLIIAVAPSEAATDVGVPSVVSATFSLPVDAATLTADTFALRDATGAAVPAAITYDEATLTATLAPAQELAYSATYTYGLTNAILSGDGRELANDKEVGFSTEHPPPLRLLSSSPSHGATLVPQGAVLSLVFSEPVDDTTVTATSVSVTDTAPGGDTVLGAFSVDGAMVTFTPELPLAYSSLLEIVLDASLASARATPSGGQLEGAPITISATVVDPPPLLVVASQPPDGATVASVTDPVVVNFSEDLDASTVIETGATPTVALTAGATAIPVSVVVTSNVVTITPADAVAFGSNLLAYDTDYTLTLTAAIESVDADPARSVIGTLEQDVTITFHTTPPPDLLLVSASPAHGAKQVGLSHDFVLVFSEPIDDATFAGAVSLAPSAGTLVASASGSTVTISHNKLAEATEYTLSLTTDLLSERGGPLTSNLDIVFDTIPFQRLRVTATTPPNLAIGLDADINSIDGMEVVFSADVVADKLCGVAWASPASSDCPQAPAGIQLIDGADPSQDAVFATALLLTRYDNNGGAGPYVATLQLSSGTLVESQTYTMVVKACPNAACASGAWPVDANVLFLPADFYSRFTTRLTSTIALIEPTPDNGCVPAGGSVNPTRPAVVVFTEDVECASVSIGPGGNFGLTYDDIFGVSRDVPGSVACDGADPSTGKDSSAPPYTSNRVTFTPAPSRYDCLDGEHHLPPTSRITLTVGTTILRASDGSALLAAPESRDFCTTSSLELVSASSDNDVVAASPVQQSASIPVDSRLTLTFDQAIDAGSAVANGSATGSVLIELLEVDGAESNLAKCAVGLLEPATIDGDPTDANAFVIQPPPDAYCYGAHYRVTVRGGAAAGSPPGVVSETDIALATDTTVDFRTDAGNWEIVSDMLFPMGAGCVSTLNQNSNVEVQLGRPLLQASLDAESLYVERQDTNPPTVIATLPVLSADRRAVTLVPGPELPGGVDLLLVMSRKLRDWRGNPFPDRADRCGATPPEAGFTALFIPVGGNTFGVPTWSGTTPAPAATNVPGSVRPEVILGDTGTPNGIMQQTVNCDSIVLTLNGGGGENLCDRVVYSPGDCNSGSPPCTATVWPAFASMLDSGTYTLSVGESAPIVDLTIVEIDNPGAATFTVADGHAGGDYTPSGPVLEPSGADAPVTTEVIRLTFDMDLRPGSVIGGTTVSVTSGGALAGSFDVTGSGMCGAVACVSNVIRFFPDDQLPGSGATVVFNAIRGGNACDTDTICDAEGHPLNATVTENFTTNDETLSVESVDTSTATTTDVPVDASIIVLLNSNGATLIDAIDAASVQVTTVSGGVGNVQLIDTSDASASIPICARVEGLTADTIRLTPVDPLPNGHGFQVRVGTSGNCGTPAKNVADVAGNTLAACDETLTFTTVN